MMGKKSSLELVFPPLTKSGEVQAIDNTRDGMAQGSQAAPYRARPAFLEQTQ